MTHTIQAGDIYTACHPLDEGRRIRITEYVAGANRADVVDADTGLRPRSILVKDLHQSAVTATGRPRRTGYVRTPFLPTRPDSEPRTEAAPAVVLPAADKVLRIVATWYRDVNDGCGYDADDLARELEKAGYPLPDIPEEDGA
ncbi:hypothetical protein [Streptomyces mobaraensis]|uniref:Uncharacterized protein n=1 Tax=Streptomyces mobaraensis TaxID=35621 RepID=A0A5N5WCU8_STRMB|nr:hypothetical protein [Streptomyces mobaraensis]KAB7850166.1 hypothetical protein FRZ00_06095 [Streptomyces mobaraensis]